jgi:dihydrofolate reductase
MRSLVYTALASRDHRLARADGALDWLPADLARADGGLPELHARTDTIILGRLTYERHYLDGPWPFAGRRCIVLSRRWRGQRDPHVEFFGGHLPSFLQRLKKSRGGVIRLLGGAACARACLATGLVDEAILTVVPVTLGEGPALPAPRGAQVRLMLRDSQTSRAGVARLTYAVTAADGVPPDESTPDSWRASA